jgi:ribosomal protein S18 acetylase RimI-like enzyme
VHDVWRVPGVSEPGIGAALIAQAMRLLDEDGQPVLGLTVSDGNPARRVYERLGFQPVLESWTLHLPPAD